MPNKQDKWERLNNMLDEYQVDESLAQNAINKAMAEKDKKKSFSWKWLAISMSALVLILAIVLPICLYPKTVETQYFDEQNVYAETIEDMYMFISESNLGITTLDLINGENNKVYIKETNELAYFKQSGIYVSDAEFDTVQLYVVVKPNSEFDFCEGFSNLTQMIECNKVFVNYYVTPKGTQSSITAYFEAKGYRYYIEITTYGVVEEKLNFYVNLLAN